MSEAISEVTSILRSAAFDCAIDALKEDSARYQWLKGNLYGADFEYGEPSTSVVVFFWPDGATISADLDKSIDGAMAASDSAENEMTK